MSRMRKKSSRPEPKKRVQADTKGHEEEIGLSADPLEHWSVDTDPAVMSGDRWVDEDHDFGHSQEENEELEEGVLPGAHFMHPMHDVSYRKD